MAAALLWFCTPGGHDGEGLLDTVERFDPEQDTWMVVTSLSSPRCLGGLVAMKGFLYTVGGYDGASVLQSLQVRHMHTHPHTYTNSLLPSSLPQRYSPHNDEWVSMTPLPIQRSGFGSAVMDNLLYVCGGCNNLSKVCTVLHPHAACMCTTQSKFSSSISPLYIYIKVTIH